MKIEPKGAKREPKGAKMKPKATKREPKGDKGEPKGAKGEPKDDQNASKNQCPKKRGSSIYFLVNFGPILGAKNLQKPLVLQYILDFRDFLKS